MGRTACRWFLALGLLGSLTAHAAGPVWAVRGAHNPVYLAGSVHLLPAQDAVLPSAFDRAYADSGQLVMELDLGQLDPLQVAGWMTEHGALPAGSTLRGVLGEPRYTRVSAAAADLGLSMEVLDGQSPWIVGIELADLEYLHLGFDPQQGVEAQLVQRAQSDGKPTAGLETLSEELGGLEALSREDQLRLLDQTLTELKESASEMQAGLGAWRPGAPARLPPPPPPHYPALPRRLP